MAELKGTRKKTRLQLIGVIAVFVVPLLLAIAIYQGSWSLGIRHHGALLEPISELPDLTGVYASGEKFSSAGMKGSWWLLVVDNGLCNLQCAADLFKIHQIRLVLGRDRERVRLVYMTEGVDSSANLAPWLKKQSAPSAVFRVAGLVPRLNRSGIYVVDPNGNLVLYYDEKATAKGIKSDVRHLLKVSRIG